MQLHIRGQSTHVIEVNGDETISQIKVPTNLQLNITYMHFCHIIMKSPYIFKITYIAIFKNKHTYHN